MKGSVDEASDLSASTFSSTCIITRIRHIEKRINIKHKAFEQVHHRHDRKTHATTKNMMQCYRNKMKWCDM